MKICFVVPTIKFDVATPLSSPLGGTESSVSYLARALVCRGHAIYLLSHNDSPGMRLGCHCLDVGSHWERAYFDEQDFDVVVLVHRPEFVLPLSRELLPRGTPIVFWCHLGADQPELQGLMDRDLVSRISALVCVSRHQKDGLQKTFFLQEKLSVVIHNGLTPSFVNLFESAETLRSQKGSVDVIAYTSIPSRGLEVLIDIMESVPSSILLKSYSGMAVYRENDDVHMPLFERARCLPNVELVGSLPQPGLANRLRSASFFVYPCTVAETFCIAAMEAMAAGLELIVTDRGALPETCGGFPTYVSYQWLDSDSVAARQYFREVLLAKRAEKKADMDSWAEKQFQQAAAVSASSRWELRASEWERMLIQLIRK